MNLQHKRYLSVSESFDSVQVVFQLLLSNNVPHFSTRVCHLDVSVSKPEKYVPQLKIFNALSILVTRYPYLRTERFDLDRHDHKRVVNRDPRNVEGKVLEIRTR